MRARERMGKGGTVRGLGLLSPGRAPTSFGRKGLSGVLLLVLLLLAPLPALAQAADPAPTVLHLSQTAERRVMRDLLRVELRLEETGADPLALQGAEKDGVRPRDSAGPPPNGPPGGGVGANRSF